VAVAMLITSRHNEQVKQIRSLADRRHRSRAGLFLVEGPQLVAEAAEVGAELVALVVAPDLLSEEALHAFELAVEQPAVRLIEVTPAVMESISPRHGSEGLAAVVRQRWQRLADVDPSTAPCWVAVNQIGQPWSIGTIIRITAAVGGGGVILIGDSTDPYETMAVRASLGMVLSQQLVKAGLEEFARWAHLHGCSVVGTSPAGSADYHAIAYHPPVVVFMGSERIGLSPDQQAVCDTMVRIPMAGRCESHHVAVATGVVLYEIFNQLRAQDEPLRNAG
jgi:RNA methyltransferase, TrmH family